MFAPRVGGAARPGKHAQAGSLTGDLCPSVVRDLPDLTHGAIERLAVLRALSGLLRRMEPLGRPGSVRFRSRSPI